MGLRLTGLTLACALALSAAVSLSTAEAVAADRMANESEGLLIVYPKDSCTIDCSSSFIIGSCPAGSAVTCNGEQVRTNSQGFFAHVVKLSSGKNNFTVTKTGGGSGVSFTITRPPAPALLPAFPLKALAETAGPADDLGVAAGDIIQLALRASPGSTVTATIGKRTIPLYSMAQGRKSPGVNMGRDTAFGVTFQRTPSSLRDLYSAFYKLTATDAFAGQKVLYSVSKGGKTIRIQSKGKVTTLSQPKPFKTIHDDTIVRFGPGAARTTPLPEGVRLLCDGYRGNWKRLELAQGKHVWIAADDLEQDPYAGQPPESKISTVNLGSDSYGAWIRLPMSQRLPFRVDQTLVPPRLVLSVFGATADTDFVTAEQSERLEPKDTNSARLIDFVGWRQKDDGLYELQVALQNKVQWGFYANYEDTDLVLHIKAPPPVRDNSLRGWTICVDPGHGGRETGSIGCSGLKEAEVNLAMSEKLKIALESMGAKVVMTRTADNDVSLGDRVKTAIDSGSDILVSVHNNALPDGRNPWTEHGSSTYWYHKQSLDLARSVRENLVASASLNDFGTRYQNLFLCRPTNMPAMLAEVGFMIHPDEFAQLINPAFQQKVAEGIANGVKSYVIKNAPANKQ